MTINCYDPESGAARVVRFLADLHGMDNLDVPRGNAAINLLTGQIIRPHEDFPDGEMLYLDYAPGINNRAPIHAHKLVESLLVRHAEAITVIEGGNIRDHYEHIADHFQRKTVQS